MVLKRLQCCGNSSSPEQRRALRSINTHDPLKKYTRKLGGISPIHSMHWRGAPGLMWGARGAFLPAATMVVAVVTPVMFCAKATEKRYKNTKISCLSPKSLFITIYCKTCCNSYIANCSVVEPQLWHDRSLNQMERAAMDIISLLDEYPALCKLKLLGVL